MSILNFPTPTKEKGQRSLSAEDAYFTRFVPSWTFPSGLSPAQWRYFVQMQPVAVVFRDTLISTIQSLDWKVTPRDAGMLDELKMSARYHTKLLEHGGYWLDMDWTGMLEWILTDLMDLPFGTAVEVGRKNDSPEGRVAWFKPIDGGTLYPTLNKNFPVVQYYQSVEVVSFPKHAINRMYLSPSPKIEREGWGMAPPEKIYLAMEMLARGDRYYADLLLDVPPAGLLDLMDMEKDEALDWIKSFRTFVTNGGSSGFMIPVLYEHTKEAKFIPFGKVPNDIMYDRITLKYASLIGAAYGMSLNDIGLQGTSSSGETLAGSIRSERRTRKTGMAKLKRKLKFFFENMLPDTLQFDFVDMDDELATALGRARLANATAWGQLIERGIFSREEARLQSIQDGLVTIPVEEEPPSKPDDFQMAKNPGFGKKPQERPGMLGNPQPPSQGGDGEVKKSVFEFKSQPSALDKAVESVVSIFSPNIQEILNDAGEDNYEPTKSMILESIFSEEDQVGMGEALRVLMSNVRFGDFRFDGLERELLSILDSEGLYAVNTESHIENLKSKIRDGFPEFVGRAIVYLMIESQFPESGDVQKRIADSLEEYAHTFVALEMAKTLDEIRNGPMEVPETLRVRSVIRNTPLPPQITVEAPQISLPAINVSVPERSFQVEAPVVNVNQPDIFNEINIPKQDAPVVNLSQEAPVVNVTVPERETKVQVDAPVVNVSVPAQNPQITVNVEPTPVEITNDVTVKPADVNIPKPVREIQQVIRDINQNISATDTEIKYEEE